MPAQGFALSAVHQELIECAIHDQTPGSKYIRPYEYAQHLPKRRVPRTKADASAMPFHKTHIHSLLL